MQLVRRYKTNNGYMWQFYKYMTSLLNQAINHRSDDISDFCPIKSNVHILYVLLLLHSRPTVLTIVRLTLSVCLNQRRRSAHVLV